MRRRLPEHLRVPVLRVSRRLIELILLLAAWGGAYVLRFDGLPPDFYLRQALVMAPAVVALKYLLMVSFEVHRHSWRFVSMQDVVRLGEALSTASLLLLATRFLTATAATAVPSLEAFIVPLGVLAIDFMAALLGLAGVRALRHRLYHHWKRRRTPHAEQLSRALLVGAGQAGSLVAKELDRRPDVGIIPVGFVDDDPAKHGRTINGIRVLGTTEQLPELVKRHDPDEAVICIADAPRAEIRTIVSRCEDAGLETRIIPGVYELVDGRVNLSRIRPVALEDLLGRDPVDIDECSIRAEIAGTSVLVTGAGGSIGAELCRQLIRFHPREVVLLERAEHALWAIQRELESRVGSTEVVAHLADICDAGRVGRILQEHQPTILLHAAAHKHVPLVEANPGEAVRNNVVGTKIVADAAVEHGVRRFVLVSTDKAVKPTSVMGATKRIAERYVQHLAQASGRPYVSVRFGNVLGSNGSVVPVFREQIEAGGPVTVTHPDMQRYFMTIPEACQLVLQAGTIGRPGQILVLDMGEPIRILDLAEDLIRLSGYEPHEDIEIEFIGRRPGEKLSEDLELDHESIDRTEHPKIFVRRSPTPTWSTWDEDLERLGELVDSVNTGRVRRLLQEIVPHMTGPEAETPQPGR